MAAGDVENLITFRGQIGAHKKHNCFMCKSRHTASARKFLIPLVSVISAADFDMFSPRLDTEVGSGEACDMKHIFR